MPISLRQLLLPQNIILLGKNTFQHLGEIDTDKHEQNPLLGTLDNPLRSSQRHCSLQAICRQPQGLK